MRHGTNLEVAYFDQMREQLDLERSVAETVSPGSDWVEIGAQRKHVVSYLGDFLFAPQRVDSPVQDALGRRAQPPAARATVRAAGERAGARRADQRPRHRFARAARVDAAGVRRHGAAGEPRPRVPRQRRDTDARGRGRRHLAGVRRRLQGLARAAASGQDRRRRRGRRHASASRGQGEPRRHGWRVPTLPPAPALRSSPTRRPASSSNCRGRSRRWRRSSAS